MALIGLIMLMGIVVKNGIVLIDYTILCRERGMGILTAVVTAGKSRLRPVLMTTLTTVLGMIPMAVGTGEGSEMWRSMGMTVDHPGNCTGRIQCICRKRSPAQTPQDGKKWNIF